MNDLNNSRNLSVRWLACCLRLPLPLPVLTAVLVLATPAAVQAQFSYTVTNQTVTITGYTGTSVVAIPSTINGLPVTSIGDYAFSGSSITAVTIPNSVINIGNFAFGYCFSLTNIMVDPLNSAFSSVDGCCSIITRRHLWNIRAVSLEATRSPTALPKLKPVRSLDAISA